jgi:hypothetical protein
MSEVTLNLQSYKASGVYFEEIDNSISTGSTNTALRIAIGYNEMGPFNRPIYLSSTSDCDEILGDIDRRLERKGCFTNRNIRTMVKTAPVYALNLLNPGNASTDICAISFDSAHKNIDSSTLFKNLFDRSRFWIADSDKLMDCMPDVKARDKDGSINKNEPLYAIGNCGTRDISLIVRKAEDLTGYNVTFLEWYGDKDNIPYKWINPTDYVSDYFIQVIAVAGDYSTASTFAADPTWKTYFDESGIKKTMINKFLRLDNVTVLGNWIGCIIPEFYDKQGKCKSIDYLINRTCNKTGLLFGINTADLDELDSSTNETGSPTYYQIDTITKNICASTAADASIAFMSYEISQKNVVCTSDASIDASCASNEFIICASNSDYVPVIGDFVRANDETLTRIIKKRTYIKIESSTGTDSSAAQESSTGTDSSAAQESSTGTDSSAAQESSMGTDSSEQILGSTGNGDTYYKYTTIAAIKHCSTGSVTSSYAAIDDMAIDNVAETTPENEGFQDYMVYGVNDSSADSSTFSVEIHKNIANVYTNLKFIHLKGLKIDNKLRPGYDASGVIDIEKGVEKIYSMLEDTGIKRGLLNNEMVDFRYVVDTLTGGLGTECGGKKYLARLAKEKGHCTAIINAPSITDFANSTAPYFSDDPTANAAATFDAKYIPDGGNQDAAYKTTYEDFSLPTEDNGAKFAAVFSPYLKYTEGTRTFLVPPAADVCDTFMQKYLGGDPYKTVANLNGIVTSEMLSGLEYDFDKTDRGYIEPFGINPIISRNGTITIYGDRTCYQTVNSDFNFLHVRELLNTIELRCTDILKDYIYTYNNAVTRAEIYNRVEPILKAMKDSGALAKYTIQVDENNNTQEIIDEKFCIVDIGVWVTPNMEKIVTRIKVNRGSEA